MEDIFPWRERSFYTVAIIAVETFHDSIHDVLEDLGLRKAWCVLQWIKRVFKSLIHAKSECISRPSPQCLLFAPA